MNQNEIHKCLHCDSQLPLRVNATICRNCKFKGHKEFGNCLVCAKKYNIDQISISSNPQRKSIN